MTKEEKREYDKAHYLANKEKRTAQKKAWYEANKEERTAYRKAHYLANKEKGKAQSAQWAKDNPEKKLAMGRKSTAKRRALMGHSVFTELDEFAFDEAVSLCKAREETLGGKWEVDHIVPLNHKDACGLHVAANFQVVPAEWNRAKGNRTMAEFIIGNYNTR